MGKNEVAIKKQEFISQYGAAAYLKLTYLAEILEENKIDIQKVDKRQIAQLLGLPNLVLV